MLPLILRYARNSLSYCDYMHIYIHVCIYDNHNDYYSIDKVRKHYFITVLCHIQAPTTLPLWKEISRLLLAIQSENRRAYPPINGAVIISDNASHLSDNSVVERSMFALGWIIQHFVDDPALRSQFIDLALRDGQGHSLLDLQPNFNLNYSKSFVLVEVDAVAISVLKAASEETLSEAFRSYVLQPQKSISDTAEGDLDGELTAISSSIRVLSPAADNALCCVTIGLTPEAEAKYPQINSFIDPLSLVKAAASSHDVSEIKTSTASGMTMNSRVFQIAPKSPSLFIDSKIGEFFADYRELLSVALPVCMGREGLSFWDTVKLFKDAEDVLEAVADQEDKISVRGSMDRGALLRAIEVNESLHGDTKIISAVCQLLSHPNVIGTSYTLHLLAAYMQTSPSPAYLGRHTFLIGTFSAIAICCTIPDILKIEKSESKVEVEGLLKIWCDAYLACIISLLEKFTSLIADIDIAGTEKSPLPSSESCLKVTSYFSLMQSLLTISISTNNASTTIAIQEYLQTNGTAIRSKMNKWIKSSLKFGLYSKTVLNGLSSFFSATRSFFHSSLSTKKETIHANLCLFWESIFEPKVSDFYHPSLVLQMIVSHSKFTVTLRGGSRQLQVNTPLLNLLLVLISITLPLKAGTEAALSQGESLNLSGNSSIDQY